MRSFDVDPGPATHVRLRVLTNQCTGNPQFNGEDSDPRTATACTATSDAGRVQAAEFEVFAR
jgi:hypothetical protein